MTEVRDLSTQTAVTSSDGFDPNRQYGLFATKAYKLGETILTEESPLIILSQKHCHPSNNDIRSQFDTSCFPTNANKKSTDDGGSDNKEDDNDIISDIILPASFKTDDIMTTHQTKKLKALIVVAASYAVQTPTLSEEAKNKLLQLYHPSSIDTKGNGCDGSGNDEEKDVVKLATLALNCCKDMAASDSSLKRLVQDTNNTDELIKLLLIYSCNAFEGGRIYHEISRINHSCNPNAVVCEGKDGGDGSSSGDTSVVKAACDIKANDEINISYLGKYLYAGYPTRQKVLRDAKYFSCRCSRCNNSGGNDTHDDLASRIPCPRCHPRTGRYLDEDVMFDDDDDSLVVSYAVPKNGLTPEQRSIKCEGCEGITSFDPNEESLRKKKEALCIKYMSMAEEKVYDRLENNDKVNDSSNNDKSLDVVREADLQFYQMATSICGAKHWTTHFMNLSLIEESLANFHSTLMSMGQNTSGDTDTMDELLTDIAEAADGIDRAWKYARGLNLNIDPSHWLFDYTVGLARTLVGLGDEKSQKYASEWLTKVDEHAKAFESDAMNKVVTSLKTAWQRHSSTDEREEKTAKRQKVAK